MSELHALPRFNQFIKFYAEEVTLYPNPNFFAKNENPQVRRDSIFIFKTKK